MNEKTSNSIRDFSLLSGGNFLLISFSGLLSEVIISLNYKTINQ
jgi:hypothetical protein